jgi:uncharacterized protein YbaR (Trm112 family)
MHLLANEGVLRCPTCKGSKLRAFDRRLVCDRCEGMLIELDDFANALNTTEELELIDEGPGARKCPRCLRAMRGCRLRVGPVACDEVLAVCPDDGLWFGSGALEHVFARVERHLHRGGGGNPEQGVSSMYVSLRRPRNRRTPPQVPITGLRKRRLACPVCEGDLDHAADRFPCTHCAGAFVENHSLEAMMSDLKQAPWLLAPLAGKPGSLACPVCAGTMHTDSLEQVVVDRCGDHGVWFDAPDLASALRHASGVDQRRGVMVWLKRWF